MEGTELTGIVARLLAALALLFAAMTQAVAQTRPPVVLAAASLQESLTAAAQRWAAKGHPKPVLSFAASSALARQVEAGAPADLFISADEDWMNYLAQRRLIQPRTRVSFLTNGLVLVAPAASRVRLTIGPPRQIGLERQIPNTEAVQEDPIVQPLDHQRMGDTQHQRNIGSRADRVPARLDFRMDVVP